MTFQLTMKKFGSELLKKQHQVVNIALYWEIGEKTKFIMILFFKQKK